MLADTAKWRLSAAVLLGCAGLSLGLRGCVELPPDLQGDAENGKILFEDGDGTLPGCQFCHCPDARGGCSSLNAPNIQGKPYETVNDRTRGSAAHPGGKFNFTDQEVADIVAHLATLVPPN